LRFTNNLAALSVGSSETCGTSIFGLRPSSMPALTDMPVLPCPTFAPGVHAAASAGRRPIGIEQGIAALHRVTGTSCADAALARAQARSAAADVRRVTASDTPGRNPPG